MQTESVSFDLETHLQSVKMSDRGGDLGVTSNPVMSQQPAKKATRQWAAWTRQEEESFFTALRQVGKNFEKITCRVQSKNKDQVRYYYYRLIRRMNKLLGPGLCLDSKNSKDTNAAMLRWWSLLEKYSCRASKLHLKPRRCKIFIEALEHQLLRDRKKNGKKQPLQGDNYLLTAPNVVSNQSRGSELDDRTVKLVLVDSQNISKLSPTKTLLKRNVNTSINRGNNRGDSAVLKPVRQRKKPNIVSPAAYRKWEKAAIAGVSLVADAAEHLERTANTEFRLDQSTSGQKISNSLGLPRFSISQQNLFVESSISPTKLKLQLFPMDDSTRKSLEMDKHNPHLELTLSARKKISSVLEHLNRKWGNSSAACGELKLFPYCVQRENLSCNQMWTQDSIVSAAEVYASIGSPSLFRLRYGWFLYSENGLFTLPVASCCNQSQLIGNRNKIRGQNVDTGAIPVPSTNTQSPEICEDQLNSANMSLPTSAYHEDSTVHIRNVTHDGKNSAAGIIPKDTKDVDDLRLSNGTSLSAGEWADSLTNVSVGDLLSGVSQEIDTDCIEPPVIETQCLQQIPFSCDSFDVAIQQEKMKFQSTLASNIPSIWDAEETCDAFSFHRSSIFNQEVPSTSSFTSSRDCQQITRMNLGGSSHTVKDLPKEEKHVEDQDQIEERESNPQDLENSAKDICGLEDMYWPDSLGPLELDMPSSKYLSENVILSDSLSGLNRLIASSLDAFQNWTFFVSDKKESAPTPTATVEKASFSDFKIGS